METGRKAAFVLRQWTSVSEPEIWHRGPGSCGSVFSSLTPTPAKLGTVSETPGALAGQACGQLSAASPQRRSDSCSIRPTTGQQQLQVGNHKKPSARWTRENLKMSAVTLEWAEAAALQVTEITGYGVTVTAPSLSSWGFVFNF